MRKREREREEGHEGKRELFGQGRRSEALIEKALAITATAYENKFAKEIKPKING